MYHRVELGYKKGILVTMGSRQSVVIRLLLVASGISLSIGLTSCEKSADAPAVLNAVIAAQDAKIEKMKERSAIELLDFEWSKGGF